MHVDGHRPSRDAQIAALTPEVSKDCSEGRLSWSQMRQRPDVEDFGLVLPRTERRKFAKQPYVVTICRYRIDAGRIDHDGSIMARLLLQAGVAGPPGRCATASPGTRP